MTAASPTRGSVPWVLIPDSRGLQQPCLVPCETSLRITKFISKPFEFFPLELHLSPVIFSSSVSRPLLAFPQQPQLAACHGNFDGEGEGCTPPIGQGEHRQARPSVAAQEFGELRDKYQGEGQQRR